jgi:hypothetical protein
MTMKGNLPSVLNRRGLLAGFTWTIATKPLPAAAEVQYELGPLKVVTEDDSSLAPTIIPPVSGALDPSEVTLEVTNRAFLELAVGGTSLGTISIDLYGKVAPATVNNFIGLCRGSNDVSYRGSSVFRVIPGLNIGLGDVAGKGDACVKLNSCVSASGGPVPAENFRILHSTSVDCLIKLACLRCSVRRSPVSPLCALMLLGTQ